MDWEATFWVLLVVLLLAATIWYFQYIRPRTNAFKFGQSRVSIWFRWGELILWNPGQTFAFLRNKKLAFVGDAEGGMKTIYPYRGEEAVGPIQLQSALFTWNDSSVLTRDGQVLTIKVGVWWKVADAPKYVFHIYSDPATDLRDGNSYAPPPPIARGPGSGIVAGRTANSVSMNAKFDTASMHRVADQWLRVITESTVRAKVNNLAVADVVSAQAMQFLKYASEGTPIADTSITGTFEAAILDVRSDIQHKAIDFGLLVERLEVQQVLLPPAIQNAINETRIAFLAPIKGEREAEAARIKLEKLISVLGKDTVGLNEIMKNFQNANFMTPLNFMQPLMQNLSTRAEALPSSSEDRKQLPNG